MFLGLFLSGCDLDEVRISSSAAAPPTLTRVELQLEIQAGAILTLMASGNSARRSTARAAAPSREPGNSSFWRYTATRVVGPDGGRTSDKAMRGEENKKP